MKTLALALLPVLALSAFGVAHSRDVGAPADSIIQRCETTDGNAVYTDKPCALFQAQPTRLSDDLAIRLALAAAESRSDATAMGAYADAGASLQVVVPGRRSAAAGCARSPDQLSRDLVGAFALHDVNRVAESYHWAGMNQRQALPVMKQLERLSTQPLSDARFLAAWIGSGEDAAHAMPRDAGLMQLVFADHSGRIVDFNVRRYAGCYFIAA
ncbi:hypothetical protein [Lysobacter solisilvae (ex Woo and Kim 2020)]|uniref:DUF4124 domain-containing protein n=1 Tax=Agrilutibacter terrestris TaxID=2865112 RepID=A0A7H0FUV0_9GAMM|nr:hypothetical protein [Lysobacter terrestris]QNP39816.1 hypothetical protein H8B22_09880 [Lysobacter terrestris]